MALLLLQVLMPEASQLGKGGGGSGAAVVFLSFRCRNLAKTKKRFPKV